MFQQNLKEQLPSATGACYIDLTTPELCVYFYATGVNPEDAPVHEHVQKTDYNWFVMNDGGYILTAVNMCDVKYYCWYRPE